MTILISSVASYQKQILCPSLSSPITLLILLIQLNAILFQIVFITEIYKPLSFPPEEEDSKLLFQCLWLQVRIIAKTEFGSRLL